MRRREVEKMKFLKSVQDEKARNHCFNASREGHRVTKLQWGSVN